MTASHADTGTEFDDLDSYITGQLGKAAAVLAAQASTQARLDSLLQSCGRGDATGGTAGSPDGG
jgi:hypothetical protein